MLNLLQQNKTTDQLKEHIKVLDELNQRMRNICFSLVNERTSDLRKMFTLYAHTLEVDNILKRIQGG